MKPFVGLGALALLVVACSPATSSVSTSPLPTASSSLAATASPSDPYFAIEQSLTGEWDTGPVDTTEFGGTQVEFHLTFYYEASVPFVLMNGWDPSQGPMPEGGDHGPYQLLPNNQMAIGNFDHPEISTLYSYELDGDELTITWVANDPDAPPEDVGGPFSVIHLVRVS